MTLFRSNQFLHFVHEHKVFVQQLRHVYFTDKMQFRNKNWKHKTKYTSIKNRIQ